MCWDPKQLHAWWQKAPLQQSNLLMFILIPANSNLVIKSNGVKTAILNAQRTLPHFWLVITHVAERLWCLCFADHQKLFFFQTFILPLFIYFFFPFLSTVFGLLQEGQVLECSLINSIRVGAVPKVRTQERPFLHFCLHKIHTLSPSASNIPSFSPTEVLPVKSRDTATSGYYSCLNQPRLQWLFLSI